MGESFTFSNWSSDSQSIYSLPLQVSFSKIFFPTANKFRTFCCIKFSYKKTILSLGAGCEMWNALNVRMQIYQIFLRAAWSGEQNGGGGKRASLESRKDVVNIFMKTKYIFWYCVRYFWMNIMNNEYSCWRCVRNTFLKLMQVDDTEIQILMTEII